MDSPRDFVDVYLKEIHKTSNKSSSFYGQKGEDSLIAVLLDLFLAGNCHKTGNDSHCK